MSELNLDVSTEEEVVEQPEVEESADEAPEVEAQAEPDDEPEERPEPRSQKRIRQEIEKRKELENQLAQIRQQNQLMEQRFAEFQQRLTPRPKEEEPPSFDDDPAAHLLWKQQQIERALQYQHQMGQQQAQHAQRQQYMHAIQSRFDAEERQFAQQAPDYFDAVNHLKNERIRLWTETGLTADEAQQRVLHEAWGIVEDAQRRGAPAAKVFYELARQSGFSGKNVVEQVARAAQNQKRSQSLGTRGSTPKPTSLAELASMSEDEFAKATEGDNWYKLVGHT